jgi:hypothetical protein
VEYATELARLRRVGGAQGVVAVCVGFPRELMPVFLAQALVNLAGEHDLFNGAGANTGALVGATYKSERRANAVAHITSSTQASQQSSDRGGARAMVSRLARFAATSRRRPPPSRG